MTPRVLDPPELKVLIGKGRLYYIIEKWLIKLFKNRVGSVEVNASIETSLREVFRLYIPKESIILIIAIVCGFISFN